MNALYDCKNHDSVHEKLQRVFDARLPEFEEVQRRTRQTQEGSGLDDMVSMTSDDEDNNSGEDLEEDELVTSIIESSVTETVVTDVVTDAMTDAPTDNVTDDVTDDVTETLTDDATTEDDSEFDVEDVTDSDEITAAPEFIDITESPKPEIPEVETVIEKEQSTETGIDELETDVIGPETVEVTESSITDPPTDDFEQDVSETIKGNETYFWILICLDSLIERLEKILLFSKSA